MRAESRRRLMLLGALVVGGGALGVIASGALDDNLVYFWTPSELQENSDKAQNVVVRLGGQVKPESKNWDPDARHLEFVMTDGDTEVAVEFNGDLPEMFREGVGVVVEGTMGSDGVFRSEVLLVKHDNEYQKPEEGETDPEMLKSANTLEAGS
jgi:cytochrome c-type biogenesis protein CcmE